MWVVERCSILSASVFGRRQGLADELKGGGAVLDATAAGALQGKVVIDLTREFGGSDREQIENANKSASATQVLNLLNGFVETRLLKNKNFEVSTQNNSLEVCSKSSEL